MIPKVELDALLEGRHSDPFAVLGPHPDGSGRTWLRALLPSAEQVEVVAVATGAALATLTARVPGVFFEASVGATCPAYRLRVRWQHGVAGDYVDPYAFGSAIAAEDIYFLGEGSHLQPWQVLGAHPITLSGVAGTRFAVWAPNASRVSVVGDFNAWDGRRHPMRVHHGAGVWEIFLPQVGAGERYKYEIRSRDGRVMPLKADPYAFAMERRPSTASIVASPAARSLPASRAEANRHDGPMSIYEVHLGSWRRAADGGFLDWDALAAQLPAYVADLGFTHLELLPVAEHPFDGSWGYQVIGLFAPTSRFGDPAGFARFLDACHQQGLGVIIDWVPAHFPTDAHGLAQFDGTALYEYADPREGFHNDWNTLIYNFGRHEVRNFLIGNALYWLQQWGVDGLRVDAVASMLYRDYSRNPGEWVPNAHGGRENLEAIAFLRRMNEVSGAEVPASVTIAEESTAWPGVSRPTSGGGLGFHYKWNLGWMHDTLLYFSKEPVHRRWHHQQLTFSLLYAFDENFVLPISHDEVVHGKGSLLGKMPGDRWQQLANVRLLLAYMWMHPGKKLLFMGCEFAQAREWNHDHSLDWHLLEAPEHRGVQSLVRDLNRLYTSRPALHRRDHDGSGFEWIAADDADGSTLAFLRKDEHGHVLLVVCNFTPVPRHGHRVGVPHGGPWREVFNSDSAFYGGGNLGNGADLLSTQTPGAHGRSQLLSLTLPPLSVVAFEPT